MWTLDLSEYVCTCACMYVYVHMCMYVCGMCMYMCIHACMCRIHKGTERGDR